MAVVAASLIVVVATAGAYEPTGPNFRISNVGTDTDAARDSDRPAVAYNPTANEYLVVWASDGLATDNEFEIFGQRLSPTGAELGTNDFRISNVGTDADADRDGEEPAVAYNSTANEYLVVWSGDGLATDGELEIFGQRLNAATGAEVGTNDFRISSAGTDTEPAHQAFQPAVAHNPTVNEYLVTWTANGHATDDGFEIFGQRLNAAGGEEGTDDFRISTVGTDTDITRNAFSSAVAYNSAANEYLVTWHGDGLATDNELEVFGQLVSAAGAELGTNDFRISNVGTDTDAARDGEEPAVAYNSAANEYLVTWHGDGLATDNELEVFGQLVSAAGAELGTNDFRISNIGIDTDEARGVIDSTLAYSSAANEYLVAWTGNDQFPHTGKFEIFGQRIGAPGNDVGGDFRISTTGSDSDGARDAFGAAVAYNSTANEYLVTMTANGLATEGELEIFGRRLADAATPPPGPGGEGNGGADTTPPETVVTAGPSGKTKSKSATIEFSGTDVRALAGFQCQLDSGPFSPCTSPHTVKVKKGKHTIQVRAIDAAGNVDPTPASRSWKVRKKKKKK